MALSITNRLTSSYFSTFPCSFSVSIFIILFILPFLIPTQAQSRLCRKSCGGIPIQYPFGLDDGCGSPYYRHILVCTADMLEFRTPSGRYAVKNINYSDPHILVTDPFMWNCLDGDNFRPTRPFSLDTSTHFTLSPQNDYLFFNCSEKDVIIERKPTFCERFPEQCDSTCDSSSYLCRHLPECANGLRSSSCCSYYPKATESLRLMLKHCATYTSVYWRNLGVTPAFNEVPEYGIRVGFDIPVTTRCLKCQDSDKGDGICGFHTERLNFLCLCNKGNSTTNCNDSENSHRKPGVVAGTATAVSVAGAFGIGVGVWYLKKVRAKAPVTHGVQSNENRLF
ncbi:PREDICTED: uncharacterized protein LOC109215408 [Nicotiana attenuata]|uniref:Wall-associated receptor kinase galacturonan-binding domain-containing protein n=1 Tax=Nicotiana attenuata TaxID=49451 RepID=A0A1J6K8K0_NICAT|nr:PREDICTED: uncharacterized protein LOC109215408 [Nicotiana attenuata]OIT26357.1 hypothetical protein A4A49_25246 [Nicotiana attenuata]